MTEYPTPDNLCGVGGCCYLPNHDGPHTWERITKYGWAR